MTELDKGRLKHAFTTSLPVPDHLEPHLKESLNRVLQNPGSLIRPEIVLKVSLNYGLAETEATDLAIALEYFHTSSLLFDDLPSMDDAVKRRGIPCLHVEFGDAGAILAALALVNRAYALVWRAVANAPAELRSQALVYLEQHLGVGGLLNGQSMDLHYAQLPHDRQTTEQVAMSKTVSLIQLTLVLPAILGGAPPSELRLLERVARYWGLSYQIVDDLKDVLHSSTESDKTVARDSSLDRPNIALVLGVPGAAERLTRLIELGDKMVRRLIALKPGFEFLESLRAELGHEALQLTSSVYQDAVGGAA